MSDLLADLRAAVGEAHVHTDPAVVASFLTDWTGRWTGRTHAVVRPDSTEQVMQVLAVAREHDLPVVTQGGSTGLVGGSVPVDGGLVLSATRLRGISGVSADGSVTVGAGTTLAQVQHAAREAGLVFGLDLSARDSATVGGLVATNAGGTSVVAYGPMRSQVLGLEAVLADGSIVRPGMAGLAKDSSGPDLAQLLVGSEGTLAVITSVRLQLRPQLTGHRIVALLPVAGIDAAMAMLASVRGAGTLLAAEWCEGEVLALVGGPPGDHLLIEAWVAADDVTRAAELLLARVTVDALVALDETEADRLWSWRHTFTESASRSGVLRKLDVCLPVHALAGFRRALVDVVAPADLLVWGHLAEGNLHINLLPAAPPAAESDVLALVIAHGGSISSEHGIGRAKRDWLVASRGAAEVAALRAIKQALDPHGRLNPGVLLPSA